MTSVGRLAHEDTAFLKFNRQILKFLQIRLETQVFQASSFWDVVSLSRPVFPQEHWNFV